jgi:hypothetical protein
MREEKLFELKIMPKNIPKTKKKIITKKTLV